MRSLGKPLINAYASLHPTGLASGAKNSNRTVYTTIVAPNPTTNGRAKRSRLSSKLESTTPLNTHKAAAHSSKWFELDPSLPAVSAVAEHSAKYSRTHLDCSVHP